MKLTPFGRAVRSLRMDYDIPMKDMAAAMGISPSYLSSIEYGEKKLADKHIESAVAFLQQKATTLQIEGVRAAAAQSVDVLNTAGLGLDARVMVAAFARKLQSGKEPSEAVMSFLNSRRM